MEKQVNTEEWKGFELCLSFQDGEEDLTIRGMFRMAS